MTDDSGTGRTRPGDADETVGTVSEEAERLLGVLAGWAKEHGEDLASGLSESAHHWAGSVRDQAADGTSCRWCPVCRAADAVRNLNPEVRTHLTVAATSLLQAAAAALDTPTPPERGRRADEGVERIDLDTPEGEDG